MDKGDPTGAQDTQEAMGTLPRYLQLLQMLQLSVATLVDGLGL